MNAMDLPPPLPTSISHDRHSSDGDYAPTAPSAAPTSSMWNTVRLPSTIRPYEDQLQRKRPLEQTQEEDPRTSRRTKNDRHRDTPNPPPHRIFHPSAAASDPPLPPPPSPSLAHRQHNLLQRFVAAHSSAPSGRSSSGSSSSRSLSHRPPSIADMMKANRTSTPHVTPETLVPRKRTAAEREEDDRWTTRRQAVPWKEDEREPRHDDREGGTYDTMPAEEEYTSPPDHRSRINPRHLSSFASRSSTSGPSSASRTSLHDASESHRRSMEETRGQKARLGFEKASPSHQIAATDTRDRNRHEMRQTRLRMTNVPLSPARRTQVPPSPPPVRVRVPPEPTRFKQARLDGYARERGSTYPESSSTLTRETLRTPPTRSTGSHSRHTTRWEEEDEEEDDDDEPLAHPRHSEDDTSPEAGANRAASSYRDSISRFRSQSNFLNLEPPPPTHKRQRARDYVRASRYR